MKLLKAYLSEEILNWLSLSLSAELCIHFYSLSQLRQASQRKMIQCLALRLSLRLSRFFLISGKIMIKTNLGNLHSPFDNIKKAHNSKILLTWIFFMHNC